MMNWRRNLPLKSRTTFKIGGPVKFFIQPKDAAGLGEVICRLKKSAIPIRLLGAGSNILADDRGVSAAVLHLGSACFKKITHRGILLEAGAGACLGALVKSAAAAGLGGAEFLAGIPGTVGGALAMNAGAFGRGICDLVEKVQVMDYNAKIKSLKRGQIKFGYRYSNLEKYIILGAVFRLKKEKKELIGKRIKQYLHYRRQSQGPGGPSAGCIFKNPPLTGAGLLIEACGLKGARLGGAVISCRHANFIVNQNNATAADVLGLMRLVKSRVKKKFHISLEPEIKIWK